MFAGWDTPLNLLKAEIDQLEYEGYTVPESIRDQIEQLHPTQDAFNEQKILDYHFHYIDKRCYWIIHFSILGTYLLAYYVVMHHM